MLEQRVLKAISELIEKPETMILDEMDKTAFIRWL